MENLHRAMASVATAWTSHLVDSQRSWTPKPPLSKEKYRFVWLPPSELICHISPWNGSIFRGLQQANIQYQIIINNIIIIVIIITITNIL